MDQSAFASSAASAGPADPAGLAFLIKPPQSLILRYIPVKLIWQVYMKREKEKEKRSNGQGAKREVSGTSGISGTSGTIPDLNTKYFIYKIKEIRI